MKKVLMMSGSSATGVLEEFSRSMTPTFLELGYELLNINVTQPYERELDEALEQEPDFAFGLAGFGENILTDQTDDVPLSLWEFMKIPYLCMFGDSPAYSFRLHRQTGSYTVGLYAFEEHLRLRRELPRIRGVVGRAYAGVINELPRESIDFEAKKGGKILFLKNGNDPRALLRFWDEGFNHGTRRALFDLRDIMAAEIELADPLTIQDQVEAYFDAMGFAGVPLVKLKLLLIAQLDDYLRRIKSEMMADVLLDYPTEVRGFKWDHLNQEGRRGRLVHHGDFLESNALIKGALALFDMSPNTTTNFHDRQLRAAGAHTLCLSNETANMRENFTQWDRLTFRFTRESIARSVETILNDPAGAVQLGIESAAVLNARYPMHDELARWIRLAELMKSDQLDAPPQGHQEFLMWPPELGN